MTRLLKVSLTSLFLALGLLSTASPANGSASPNHFVSFCIQTSQFISPGNTYTYNVVQLEQAPDGANMSSSQANQIRRLWTAERGNINGDNLKSAAFQWAIWGILGQNTYSGGNAGLQALITQYISESNGNYALANLAALTSGSPVFAQDQIIELNGGFTPQGGEVVQTPVPAGLILAVTGIVPCLALRRRHARTASAA
jgi:hypothetical protein